MNLKFMGGAIGVINYINNNVFKIKPVALVRESGLFDEDYYLSRNEVLRILGGDPIADYLESGWKQGFDPNPYFDSRWYLDANPDIARANINPLVHYIKYGAAEQRQPGPVFDEKAYRASVADDLPANVLPLAYFLGQIKTHFRNGLAYVDPETAYNKELRGEAEDAAEFDPAFYRAYYADAAGLDGKALLHHYMMIGRANGRYANVEIAIASLETRFGSLPENFDEGAYLDNYPSAAKEYPFARGGAVHYLRFGRSKGLRPSLRDTYDNKRSNLTAKQIMPSGVTCGD